MIDDRSCGSDHATFLSARLAAVKLAADDGWSHPSEPIPLPLLQSRGHDRESDMRDIDGTAEMAEFTVAVYHGSHGQNCAVLPDPYDMDGLEKVSMGRRGNERDFKPMDMWVFACISRKPTDNHPIHNGASKSNGGPSERSAW